MELGMDHHSSSFGDHYANGSFSNSILPLGSNTTEADLLVMVNDFLGESLALVNTIVSVIFLNNYPSVACLPFKGCLGIDGVSIDGVSGSKFPNEGRV
jgi:hypothetical protein